MSFTLTKFLSLLIYPLSASLLLLMVAFFLILRRYQRSGMCLLAVALSWLYVCSTGFFSNALMGYLEDGYPSRAMSAIPSADAIVLLGGAVRGHTHMGRTTDLNQHADRLVYAAELYKAGKSNRVILSGGSAQGDRSEAEQMQDLLLIMGVSARDLVLEERSRTTYENAVFTARMLNERGLDTVLLVTSAYHMRRAEGVFKAQGVRVIAAPTDYKRLVSTSVLPPWLPSAGNLSRTSYALHELIGFQVYRWQGKL